MVVLVPTLASIAQVSHARALRVSSYQELFDASDLVVIATPSTATADTHEVYMTLGIMLIDGRGAQYTMWCMGVQTEFKVSAVLKGDSNTRAFMLHHYRNSENQPVWNGPLFVRFELNDRSSYLIFLTREPDGRYAPTGGQVDPGFNAVTKLPVTDPGVR